MMTPVKHFICIWNNLIINAKVTNYFSDFIPWKFIGISQFVLNNLKDFHTRLYISTFNVPR